MRIVLLNDTRCDENPGCQGTVSALVRQLTLAVPADVDTRPRGDGYEYFDEVVRNGDARSPAAWHDCVRLLARHSPLEDALASADLVVANMEGTFHHHTIGALALGGALAVAHRMGKRVWAVNGTIDSIETWLLDAALRPSEHIAVREPRSARWLAERGVAAVASADCAFLLEGFVHRPARRRAGSRAVLYTPGVLASIDETRDVDAVLRRFQALAALGWEPVFLQIGESEAPVAASLKEAGWSVTEVGTIGWRNVGAYLRQFELVVSGRYHVLIFAAMAGVPAIALPSNTFKIEGLLELLGTPNAFSRDTTELQAALSARALPDIVDRSVIRRCQALASLNVPGGPVVVEGLDWVPEGERQRVLAELHADGPEAFHTSIDGPPSPLWPHRLACAGFDVVRDESREGRRVLTVRRMSMQSAAGVQAAPPPMRVALFGASSAGRASAARLRNVPGIQLRCFLDNDPAKWEQQLDGLQIAQPDATAFEAVDLIIPTSIHTAAIVQQVTAAGHGHKLVLDVAELA